MMKRSLPWAQLIIGIITLLLALGAFVIAWKAYDIALQQVKDIGSWLSVNVVKFHYIKIGERRDCLGNFTNRHEDTLGCFSIEIINRLPAAVVGLKLNYRVPPQNWMSEWIQREGLKDYRKEFNIPGLGNKSVMITLPIAADPIGYYCGQKKPFELNLSLKWKDEKGLKYETAKNFGAQCLRTSAGDIIFNWISIKVAIPVYIVEKRDSRGRGGVW